MRKGDIQRNLYIRENVERYTGRKKLASVYGESKRKRVERQTEKDEW